jgi:glutamate-ammonia-ligase adenylyltransferase
VVHGDAGFGGEVMDAVAEGAYALAWRPELADEIVGMRGRLEAGRGARDLKRGPGGVVDVEFLVQMFQLKYGRERPAIRSPNTWEALDALLAAKLLSAEEHAALRAGYGFLRRVQSRLRLVHNRSLDELPAALEAVDKLARRLGYETGGPFLAELENHTSQIRELFLRLVGRERGVC